MAYAFEGTMAEVCSCNVICPCWGGQEPEKGSCEGVLVYRIERGISAGVDVGGVTYAILLRFSGNMWKGNWRVVLYIDDKATSAQYEAVLKAVTGQLGGPLADMARLVGEVVSIERASITFEFAKGHSRLCIGPAIEANIEPLIGATGQQTTMYDTAFTTIPGSPAYVGKASTFRANVPQYGFSIDLKGHSAILSVFRFVASTPPSSLASTPLPSEMLPYPPPLPYPWPPTWQSFHAGSGLGQTSQGHIPSGPMGPHHR
jgi:hypothetical protein